MTKIAATSHLGANCALRPIERAEALHPDFYVDPFWLELEQREILARSWQLAGHVGAVEEIGDHIVTEAAGKPIVIVRGADNELRGFHNVCRHRAGPVALCSGKRAKRLRCAYHGWTYELDGRLRAAPEMAAAEDFDPASIRLRPVALEIWQGFLFVAPEVGALPFEQLVAGITERIAPLDLTAMKFARRDVHRVHANWKVYIDNFLEGYHVPVVHPELNRIVDYAGYETELAEWHSVQASSVSGAVDSYGEGPVFYYFIYPNIMLNIVQGRVQTNRIIPDGPASCVVEFDYYYADDEARARSAGDKALSDRVQEEDRLICERVQRGLASGAYEPGRLCPKREQAVWHWQNLLRRTYARALEIGA